MIEGSIWKNKGFLSYLFIAFLNAFTDVGHKIILNAVLMKHYHGSELTGFIVILNGFILLPFVLTFTPAGFLSNKFPKSTIMRLSAFFSIPITLMITVTYWTGQFWISFYLLFILAFQSAIYGPAKYGYIKELVGKGRLAMGNGLTQAFTVVAILLATFGYSLLFEFIYTGDGTESLSETLRSVKYLGVLLVIGATVESLLSLRLRKTKKTDVQLSFHVKKYMKAGYLIENLSFIKTNKVIRLSIVGLACFWAVNQVLLSSFLPFFMEVTESNNVSLAMGVLALAGVGLIIGSVLTGKVSKNYIEMAGVPVGAVGMVACLLTLPSLSHPFSLGLLMFCYGLFGGLFVVPLNALIQFNAGEKKMGWVLAGYHFIEKLIMLLFLGATYYFSLQETKETTLFYILFVVLLIGSLFTLYHLPQSMIRIVRLKFSRLKIKVQGFNNIPSEGGVLLLGESFNLWKWACLSIVSPRPIRLIVDSSLYPQWKKCVLLKVFKMISVENESLEKGFVEIKNALKNEVVGVLSLDFLGHEDQQGSFKGKLEKAIGVTGVRVLQFNIQGIKQTPHSLSDQGIVVSFGVVK